MFNYPDSVKNLALELFFDQALVIQMSDDKINDLPRDSYGIDSIPKPALIIKYLNYEQNVYLSPTWFNYGRITRRPVYILHNNSPEKIFRLNNNWLECFFGNLFILDSINCWLPYRFGGVCGTFICEDTVGSGQLCEVIEGFPIGNPRKLIGGYYKYSVSFKDILDNERTVITYFIVAYTK